MPYPVQKLEKHLFFVVDVSQLNDTFKLEEEIAAILEEADLIIKRMANQKFYLIVSIITYATDAAVIVNSLLPNDLVVDFKLCHGESNIGKALYALKHCCKKAGDSIIIFMTDRKPTDSINPEIKNDYWYKRTKKLLFCHDDSEIAAIFNDIDVPIFSSYDDFAKALEECLCSDVILSGRMPIDDENSATVLETGFDGTKDFVREDPVLDATKLYLLYNNKEVEIDDKKDIYRCELSACAPTNALDIMFTLTKQNDCLELTNSNVQHKVLFLIKAYEKRTIPNFSDRELGVVFDSEDLSYIANDNVFSWRVVDDEKIEIHNQFPFNIRLSFHTKFDDRLRLYNGDKIYNEADSVMFEIKEDKAEQLISGWSGGDIPDDIESDDDDLWN